MNTMNTVNTVSPVNTSNLSNSIQLNTIYSFETEVTEIENSNTFTFSQNVRGKDKSENDGFRIVFTKPDWLEAKELENTLGKIYNFGAEELLKQVVRKYLKDNAIVANTGASLPEISLLMVDEYLESTGGKLLTKDSIIAEIENNISEALINALIAKGVSEQKIPSAVGAFSEIIGKLASPATKFTDEIKAKLIPILQASNQTPVVVALLNRLNKEDKQEENLLDFL